MSQLSDWLYLEHFFFINVETGHGYLAQLSEIHFSCTKPQSLSFTGAQCGWDWSLKLMSPDLGQVRGSMGEECTGVPMWLLL